MQTHETARNRFIENIIPLSLEQIKPRRKILVSEWADESRKLSPESAASPIKWDTTNVEHLRLMMNVINIAGIKSVTFMTGNAVGKTTVLENIIGYQIAIDPCPMLFTTSTKDLAEDFSMNRFTPMMRDSECFKSWYKESLFRDSGTTKFYKRFVGGNLSIAWAHSSSQLAQRRVRITISDEVDEYPLSVGMAGDPLNALSKRTKGFWNGINIYSGKPTVQGISRIEKSFQNSNQMYYYVPCIFCGEFQQLLFEQVRFEANEEKTDIYKAWIECKFCKKEIHEAERIRAIKKGEWRAFKNNITDHFGFQCGELISPFSTIRTVAREYIRSCSDPHLFQTFQNTVLGLPAILQETVKMEISHYENRIEYSERVPDEVLILYCGVDVQQDRLEMMVKGFAKNNESWIIERNIIYGSPMYLKTWESLFLYLQKTFLNETGVSLNIEAAGIDTGYLTDEVYQFISRSRGRHLSTILFPIKGSHLKMNEIAKVTLLKKRAMQLITVGTEVCKENFYERIKIKEKGAGYVHFNQTCNKEFFEQIFSEYKKIEIYRGYPRAVWEKKAGIRNEILDCLIYIDAVHYILNPNMNVFEKKMQDKIKIEAERKTKESESEKIERDQKQTVRMMVERAAPRVVKSISRNYF